MMYVHYYQQSILLFLSSLIACSGWFDTKITACDNTVPRLIQDHEVIQGDTLAGSVELKHEIM